MAPPWAAIDTALRGVRWRDEHVRHGRHVGQRRFHHASSRASTRHDYPSVSSDIPTLDRGALRQNGTPMDEKLILGG